MTASHSPDTPEAARPARPARMPAAQSEIAELRLRLEEAEQTLQAIRSGAVDAFLVEEGGVERVYTLEAADRPYRVMVESMQQGALVVAPDGTILFANGRFAEMLGVRHERLTGTMLAQHIAAEDRAAFTSVLADGGSRADLYLERPDGSRMPAHFTLSRLPQAASPSLCVIVTDLTEQKRHEELLQAQQALQASEELLKEADRRKDEFLATLAHELRNPLAPVRSAVQILRMRSAPSPEVQWAQDLIDRQIQQMTRLVDDLLDLSRITRNQVVLRKSVIDLADVVHAALETSQPLIRQGGHDLRVALPPHPVYIDADLTRLAQVFSNLLNNAAKYTDRGGSISITAVEDGPEIVVSVRDNGVGIPVAQMPHVFEMFTQVNRALERSQAGLGIGLALVKRLVEMHGGSITGHSDGPGTGSEFAVRLPLATGPRQESREPRLTDRGPSRSSLRVLVVDDSTDNADSLGMMLRLLGNDVRTAYDGRTALEIGHEFQPEIVVLDLGMPVLDGYQTCRLIREQSWGRAARIIALTGWGQQEHRRRTSETGFDDHLVKPVDPSALGAVLAGR